jgi:outer membrane protein OmpA-like peptidoglycan-associated protein
MFRLLRLALPPLVLLGALPASAQTDPEALRIIQRLNIRPNQGSPTRGIRMPGAEAPPAPAASAPVLTPAPRPAAHAAPAAPARPAPAASAGTTAPADIPSISMTVQFATGSASLSPAAEAALAPLGRALRSAELSSFRFRIEGHTDTVGDPAMNMELSRRRAAAVRDFLVQQFGIPEARLEAVGKGQTELLVPTGDNVPEQRNRRVQVLNIGS